MSIQLNLNPEQSEAVHTNARRVVVCAGPGSGKSRVLTERIKRLIAEGTQPGQIAAVTFTNQAAAVIVERVGQRIGYAGTLHGFMLQLLRDYGTLLGMSGQPVTILEEEHAEALLAKIAKEQGFKGKQADLVEALKQGPIRHALNKPKPEELILVDYYSTLLAGNMLTFDAILHFGAELARQLRVTGELLPWTHLLVDEYQDSGDIDARIYEELLIPNKFMVGDVDQALYSFRGGNPEHLNKAARHTDSKTILLATNYRSGREICFAATRLIERNPNRVPKPIVPHSTATGTIEYRTYRVPIEEATAITKHLATRTHKELCETAILLRTNSLVKEYADTLRQWRVPVREIKRRQLTGDWKKAKALLAAMSQPDNDHLMYAWLKLARPTEADKMRLAAMEQFTTINQSGLNWPSNPSLGPVMATMEREGISQETKRRIFDVAADAQGPVNASDLLYRITEAETEQESAGEGVTVTTYHSAKGQEFNFVWLPAFEEGIAPMTRKDSSLEEERRAAFVAITRARHHLIVSHCLERKSEWKPLAQPATPSRFIKEMQA